MRATRYSSRLPRPGWPRLARKAKTDMHRLPVWLRWCLILPMAILAYALVTIAIPVVFIVVDLLESSQNRVLHPPPAPLRDYLPQLLACIAATYSFVWCGTYIAPARRSAVALALGVFIVVPYLLLTPFLISVNTRYPTWWLLLSVLISVGAAIIAVVKCRGGENDHQSARKRADHIE